MSIEAMKQALEALGNAEAEGNCEYGATDLLRAAIEQAEKQEPIAWACQFYRGTRMEVFNKRESAAQYVENSLRNGADVRLIPLYTTPPRREWVGLTDEEKHQLNDALNLQGRFRIIDAIEAKLKERNK